MNTDTPNPNPPKIVYIGAGSAVFGLKALSAILRSERLGGAELQLVDIDEPALSTMTALAGVMNREWGAGMTINGTTDRRAALPGADMVIVSIQVGPREKVWEMDWQIPKRHGLHQPYAENSGPGGLAHTARNMPVIMAIARDMETLCPEAWYLNFTNPMTRLTWAVHRFSRIKVVGMCHQLMWGYAIAMALLAERYGISIPDGFNVHTNYENKPFLGPVMASGYKHLDIKAAGINHFSWAYDIRDRDTGLDLYPQVRKRWREDDKRDFEPLSRELCEIFELMPTPGDAHVCEFLPWVHDPLAKPWEKYNLTLQSFAGNLRRRADRRELAEAIVAGERSPDPLKNLPTEGISEIAEALTFNDNTYYQQLNLPNNGLIPNLPADAIVEVPGVISSMGICGINMKPLPEPIAELCRRELSYSSMVVDACYHGNRDLALQALLCDPMINDIDRAKAILDDFLLEFAEYLPQFQDD